MAKPHSATDRVAPGFDIALKVPVERRRPVDQSTIATRIRLGKPRVGSYARVRDAVAKDLHLLAGAHAIDRP